MENVQQTYTDFHKSKHSKHIYPTEWVIRTFLGKYPNLHLNKIPYPGLKILDLGFGDCRNMPLLNNCGFDIHGVEISDEIISLATDKLQGLNIPATLRKGSNSNIPFEDEFFDFLLACHSCYYIDEHTNFRNNLLEMARVLKRNGLMIASLPAPGNFILENCDRLEDGHVIIRNDIYGLRNGYVFRTFESMEEVKEVFSPIFNEIEICHCCENYWGVQINYFLIVAKKI